MKYMTFNSSCSYTGVANMLEQLGFDTEDRTIALEMKLPCLFAHEDGTYLAGPMLQTAEWFNLYLHPIGYHMEETDLATQEVTAYLQNHSPAMLGLKTDNQSKHAVVYTGTEDGKLRFLNSKWQQALDPERFSLTEAELSHRLDRRAVVATLYPIEPKPTDLRKRMAESPAIIQQNLEEIRAVSREEHTIAFLMAKLNPLFRPLLLDTITMLTLLGESDLAQKFTLLQRDFLTTLRQDPSHTIRLNESLSIDNLSDAVRELIGFLHRQMDPI